MCYTGLTDAPQAMVWPDGMFHQTSDATFSHPRSSDNNSLSEALHPFLVHKVTFGLRSRQVAAHVSSLLSGRTESRPLWFSLCTKTTWLALGKDWCCLILVSWLKVICVSLHSNPDLHPSRDFSSLSDWITLQVF